MAGKLEGKIALVTGGSSGIGLATAQEFVAEGAYVFITGRRQAELDEAILRIGANVTAVQGDVTDEADLDRLYETVRREKGHLDIVFANAGRSAYLALEEITEEHFDSVFGLNVKSVVFTVQKALPLMSAGGSIILNASITSIKGVPAFSMYSAGKAAVRSFARGWTLDLKGRGIRVNALSPGITDTPSLKSRHLAAGIPMGRLAEPEEIAKAAVFLASDDSSYVTGIELFVDGGMAQV